MTDANGNDSACLVYSITAIDGTSSSFSYSSGKLSSISAPGSRTFTVSVNGSGDLASITNPDTGVHSFTYSSHRVTSETFGDHLANQWHYDSAGFLDQYTWGGSSSPSVYTIVAAASVGLAALAKGEAKATVTDALSFVTQYRFDDNNRLLQEIAPNGAKTTYTRDSAGYVTQIVDPLQRTTSYTRDAKEYVTRETLPDTTHRDWTYDSTYHSILTYADERGITLYTNTLDSGTGHVLSSVDALSNETDYTFSATTGLLDTTTDPVGRVLTVTWDSYRRRSNETTTYGATVLGSMDYTYSTTNGEIATTEDAGGLVTTLGHDAMGRLTSSQLGSLAASALVYDGAGLLVSETDPNGSKTENTFDAYQRGLTSQVSAGNGLQVTLSNFDDAGRTVATRSGRGFWTSFTLDAVGQTLATTDPTGAISKAVFNLGGEVTDTWDPLGGHTANSINSRGWVYSTLDARGNTWSETFDNAGNVLTSTDGRGKTTTNTWNDNGQEETSTDPSGNEIQISYWGDGSVEDQTDARGKVTRTAYDFANRKTTVTRAYGLSAAETSATIVDNTGFTITSTDGNGNDVSYVPDAYERLYQVKNDSGTVLEQDAYDNAGNRVSSIDGEGEETDFGFNALNVQITATDPNDNKTQMVPDAEGEEAGSIDGAGDVTQQVFDPRGELNITRDANGGLTKRVYDPAGNLLSLTDPVGNTTRWAYDANNNKIEETDALGNSRSWTYNENNQVASYTDKLGSYKEYTYYDNGWLHTEVWKTGPGGTTVNTITWVYNANGQPLTVDDSNGTITWTYDDLGRNDSFQDVWGKTLTYTLDAADRVTNIADPFSGSLTITWDNDNRVTQRSFSDGTNQLAIGYQYNDRDQVTEVDRYSDSSATTLVGKTLYVYDDGARVTSISHKSASNVVIDSFSYSFDHADRVSQETSTLGPTRNYSYDRTSQLLDDGTNSYSFDLNGNRTMSGYSTGTDNRLSTDGTWNYSWDDEGNLVQRENISTSEVWVYAFDHNNRLTEEDHKASSSTTYVDIRGIFKYDALGNRVEMDYDADGDGSGSAVVTKFAYDPIGNNWADLNSSGSLTTRRLFTDALDAVFARIGSGGVAWYGQDRLGSIRDYFNSTGALIDHKDFDSFGTLAYESSPSNGDRWGFTGREMDAETPGIGYWHRRWYSFDIGAFTSRDPLGFEAGDTNEGRYAFNDPSNRTDPTGLWVGSREGARWYDFVASPVTLVTSWLWLRRENERAAEQEAILAERRRIEGIRNPHLANPSDEAHPAFEARARVAVGDIGVLANVGVEWAAAGGMFVGGSRFTFDPRAGRWRNTATRALATTAESGRLAAAQALRPLLNRRGALRDLARITHCLTGELDSIAVRQCTVAIAEIRLPSGAIEIWAARNARALSPAQREYLAMFGIRSVPGSSVHAEINIINQLPAGARVQRWGISRSTDMTNVVCDSCAPSVRGVSVGGLNAVE
ncbi:MAG: RHS repeat-associated core domain-containing protein [Gemmataceae bacterium]